MHTSSFPHLAWLVAVSGFGAIIIGALLLRSATLESRSPYGRPERVRSDGAGGVRFIMAGMMVLIGYGAWRLF